jgi:hypothetical protein
MAQTLHTDDAANTHAARSAVRDHALAELADQHTADGETVKATVLRKLHRQHPAIALEDILELSVSIPTPETDSVNECLDAVLNEALEQHDAWQAPESCSGSTRAAIPATEDH